VIDASIRSQLAPLHLLEDEAAELKEKMVALAADDLKSGKEQLRVVTLQLENVSGRLGRLTDAYLDGVVERELFEEKKLALLKERKALEERRHQISVGETPIVDRLNEYLELLNSLSLSYEMANPTEKRRLLKSVTSDLRGEGKNVIVKLKSPFREVANLRTVPTGGPLQDTPRTSLADGIINILVHYINSSEPVDLPESPYIRYLRKKKLDKQMAGLRRANRERQVEKIRREFLDA
jgi:hypothetical protein